MSRPVDDQVMEPGAGAAEGAEPHDIDKGASGRVLPTSRAGLIYGTITVGAILGAESAGKESYPRTIEGIVVAIVMI